MSVAFEEIAALSADKKRALLEQLLREKERKANTLPLSFAQQRLWFLDKLEPDSPLYNIPTVIRFHGRLQHGILQRAISAIVQRHESLRTRFTPADGQPIQVIGPSVAVPLPLVDVSGAPQKEAEAE